MPNLLSIPFKKTYDIPIGDKVREYIQAHHTDTRPDALKWDINHWATLRKDGVGGVVHIDRVQSMIDYHAQLVFILTKLPVDIGLEIPYAPAFNPAAIPTTLCNLAYERASVLFNLAALFSQLAANEDRSNLVGLKQATVYYQNAAGALSFLRTSAAPKLRASLVEPDQLLDFSDAFLDSLENVMLAQGQEGVWQSGVKSGYKNGVIARLAAQVASYYGAALTSIREASPAIKHLFPHGWIPHLETKELHFQAVAQYRKSVDDLGANRYGDEIARLSQAQAFAKNGWDIARRSRSGVAPEVVQDIKSVLDTVQKALTRAERDNDLIYHHDVPPASSLGAIEGRSLVQPAVSSFLSEPKSVIGENAVIFGELLSYGAKMAIDIYNDRRRDWIREEILDRAQRLDDEATDTLRTLNLPAALEALEKPVGLPPSLLKKAEEVRQEEGPARIESSIKNVQGLAKRVVDLLNESLDMLDQEAEDDETFQIQTPGLRPASSDANAALVVKAEKYRELLEGAAQSDAVVRKKWEEWEEHIVQLMWSNEELEAAVPSSTISLTSGRGSSRAPNPTQTHARALRVLLESLDDVRRSRTQIVARATRLAEAEDITERIAKAASGIEQWVDVQPSMFEDVLDEELSKYDKFREELEEGELRQSELLQSIQERNNLFLQSRREDPSVKEREYALQSLDLAYHKYKEITRNLDEGLKFYNDLGPIISKLWEDSKNYLAHRRDEIESLVKSMQTISLEQQHEDVPGSVPASPGTPMNEGYFQPMPPANKQVPAQRTPPAQNPFGTSNVSPPRALRTGPKVTVDLPPPDSDEWESLQLPPPSAKKNTAPPPRRR